jgi:hypothetical protein
MRESEGNQLGKTLQLELGRIRVEAVVPNSKLKLLGMPRMPKEAGRTQKSAQKRCKQRGFCYPPRVHMGVSPGCPQTAPRETGGGSCIWDAYGEHRTSNFQPRTSNLERPGQATQSHLGAKDEGRIMNAEVQDEAS